MAKLPPGVNKYIPKYDSQKQYEAAYEELRKAFKGNWTPESVAKGVQTHTKSDRIAIWIEKWIKKNA